MEEKIVRYDEKNKFCIHGFLIIIIGIFTIIYGIKMNLNDNIIKFGTIAIGIIINYIGIKLWNAYKELFKNALNIKENGRVLKGNVIYIDRKMVEYKKSIETRFLVSFVERGFEEKFILTEVLDGNFNTIPRKKDPEGAVPSESYMHINIKQFFSNGYIRIDDDYNRIDKTNMPEETYKEHCKEEYVYNKTIYLNNFYKKITCDVFELDGKYVVDNYEGVQYMIREKRKLTWKDYLSLSIICVLLLGIAWLFYYILTGNFLIF